MWGYWVPVIPKESTEGEGRRGGRKRPSSVLLKVGPEGVRVST